MPDLFQSLQLRDITIRNRIGVSPMCQYSANPSGLVTNWHLAHLMTRAIGGAGLVIMEATAVEPRGRITAADTGIWSDEHIPPLQRLTAAIRQYGATPAIQIAHAGRKASARPPWHGRGVVDFADGGWETVGASPIAFGGVYDRPPRELTLQDLDDLVAAFAAAARRAHDAGFDLVEIHSAHGYLLHSFLSPISNQRSDEYGGSRENRMRLLLRVADACREALPATKPLAVRLSCTDWVSGGWTLDDSVAAARALAERGVDLVDCSSGGSALHASMPSEPGFQVPFAERIKREVDIATAAVGGITDPTFADAIIRREQADLVLLGRQFLREPYWGIHAARALQQRDKLRFPPAYDYWLGDDS